MATSSPYRPLRHRDSIRLLQFWRKEDGSIAGRLGTTRLNLSARPDFVAVSYVWGDGKQRRNICLDGTNFSVLATIYPVLEAICDRVNLSHEAWYWIDSICINQHDLEERASQVQLMGSLFSKADATVIWLGPGTSETDEAMDFFATLASRRDELSAKFERFGIRSLPGDPKDILNNARKWQLLTELLQLPWWRRAWTMQEMLLAQKPMFFCGAKTMSLGQYRSAMYALDCAKPGESLIPSDAWVTPWNRRRLLQYSRKSGYADRMGLVALLAYTSDSTVTKPKDRIYSLLGITKAEDNKLIGRPNYNDRFSVEQLYTDLVQSFIRTYHSLDIICFASHFRDDKSKQTKLPSWVPDWRIRRTGFVVPFLVSQSGRKHIGNFRPVRETNTVAPVCYAASCRIEPKYNPDDSLKLTCGGFVIDKIDGLGSAKKAVGSQGLIQSTSLTNTTARHGDESSRAGREQRLLDLLIRSMVLNRIDRYLSSPAPLTQYTSEFFELVNAPRDKIGSATYTWFLSWLRSNEDLQIRGAQIKDLCRLSPPESLHGMLNLSNASEEGLASRTYDTTHALRMNKRLFVTEHGHVGMGPIDTRKGDIVCVLFGCSVPVVLRECGDYFELVGESYLDGFMNGEIFDQDVASRDFVLV